MTAPRSITRLVLTLAAVALVLPACTEPETAASQLRQVIAATETEPRRYEYVDASLDATYRVSGLVEDDFRHAAELKIGKTRAYREVIDDDAIAVRVFDARALELLSEDGEQAAGAGAAAGAVTDVVGLVDPTAAPTAEPSAPEETKPPAADRAAERTAGQLLSGRWVKDPTGAPSLLGSIDRPLGDDPLFDALSVLRYVEGVVGEASSLVGLFNPDAPEYFEEDDPFPHPDQEAGVERFDIFPAPLPRQQDVDSTGQQQPPELRHFRKLAVYIQDGTVIKVLEKVDIAGQFEDLEERYGIVAPEGLPQLEQVRTVVQEINALRTAQGQEPLRVRSMSYELSDIGAELSIPQPGRGINANLALLQGRGTRTGADAPVEEAPATETGEIQPPQVAPPADAATAAPGAPTAPATEPPAQPAPVESG